MRVLVVGAGAVGTILHRALEELKGNEVAFLLRPGTPRIVRTKIADARSGALRVRERPTCFEADKARTVTDTILLSVRADQIEAALDMIGDVEPTVRFALVVPGDPAVVHARHPANVVVRVSPAFIAYTDEGVVTQWMPPFAKSLVQFEDEAGVPFAEELAAALTAGGVPAQAKKVGATNAMGDSLHVVLAGYALAQYDADVLAADRATLDLVGSAIGEVLALDGGSGVGAAIARKAAGPALKAMLGGSSLMPPTWRTMWRLHGPKVDSQTRTKIDQFVERGRLLNKDTPSLLAVQARLHKTPGPVVLQKEAR